MHGFRALTLLGFVTLMPSMGSAQFAVPLADQQCVNSFLAACATLRYVDFSSSGPSGKGVLTVIVANASNGSLEAGAYVDQLLFDMTGSVQSVRASAWAEYGAAARNAVNSIFSSNDNESVVRSAREPAPSPPLRR